MQTRFAMRCLTATAIAGAIAGGAKEAHSAIKTSDAPQPRSLVTRAAVVAGADWTTNGATACDKYLTPDVVASILVDPAGHTHRLTAQSCEFQTQHSGNIGITLKVASVDAFRRQMKMIAGTHPMTGVGDAAYWNQAGAVSSVKGSRGCDIEAFGVAFQATKLRDEALGRQLGAICAKLFALP